MTDHPSPRDDAGLQPERTTLAWHRTAIAFLASSLLFLRWAGQHGAIVAVVVVMAAATATWIFFDTRTRLRRVAHHFPAPGLEPATREVVVVTMATAALALAALWVTLAT